jgi:hypothetical protein
MTALSEFGIVGLTAVGDSARQADETYHRAERVLLEEANEALIEADYSGASRRQVTWSRFGLSRRRSRVRVDISCSVRDRPSRFVGNGRRVKLA